LNLLLIIKIQGYGFVEPNDKSKDLFLHISAVEQASIRELNEGQKISFTTEIQNGKISAINIKLVNYERPRSRKVSNSFKRIRPI
jgi:CspA family cold shock protein